MVQMPRSCFVASAFLCSSIAAHASTVITLRWDYVSSEISPQKIVRSDNNSLHVVLDKNKIYVNEAYNTPNAGFGSSIRGVNNQNENFRLKFAIVGGRLVGGVVFAGSQIKIVVSHTDTSCDATVSYYMRPGQSTLWGTDRNGTRHTFSEMRADNVECGIQHG